MASSEQLEREAQATRSRIEQTLSELRTRISPGQIVDQAVDYARDTASGDLVRNLSRQVAENPVPVALMGAGLVWLMMAPRRPRDGAIVKTGDGSVDTTEPASSNAGADRTATMTSKTPDFEKKARQATDAAAESGKKSAQKASSTASSAYEKGADAAARAYDKTSEFAGTAYDRAGDLIDRARETGSDAYGRARDAASQSAAGATRGVANFVRQEPLVAAGIGIALGAIIGALLPSTDLENRTMGERSDALKSDAVETAREQWQRGKEIAETGWDEAKEAARRTWEDAKDEAQRSWDDTKRAAGVNDGHAGDLTGTQAPLVPSEAQTKAERVADTSERDVRKSS